MASWEEQRGALLKQAADLTREAMEILAAESQKVASVTGDDEAALVETLKLASLTRIHRDLKFVDYVNAILEGQAKQAAEDRKELPFVIDHPYLSSFAHSMAGGALGAIPGAVIGAAATRHPEGALLGGTAGFVAGGLGGQLVNLVGHHQAATQLEREGHRMGFVTRHPYMTDLLPTAVLGPLGRVGSAVLHHHDKQSLVDQMRGT